MLTALLATAALASFSPTSDNPYFPLQPGMRWVYEGSEGGAQLRAEGSWRAGIDGAKPGIVMPARLTVGKAYRQERFRGHAEDRFRILDRDATVTVPAGTYANALRTGEWNPLEPEVRDRKWYAKGVGLVKEQTIKGGDERLELVSFTK